MSFNNLHKEDIAHSSKRDETHGTRRQKVHGQDIEPRTKESFHKVIQYHHSSIIKVASLATITFKKLHLDSGMHIHEEPNILELQLCLIQPD